MHRTQVNTFSESEIKMVTKCFDSVFVRVGQLHIQLRGFEKGVSIRIKDAEYVLSVAGDTESLSIDAGHSAYKFEVLVYRLVFKILSMSDPTCKCTTLVVVR